MQSSAVHAELKDLEQVVFDGSTYISNRLVTAAEKVQVMLSSLQKYGYFVVVGTPSTGETSESQMVMIDQSEAQYVIEQLRYTWARCAGPDPPTMESCFMMLLSTGGAVVQRGFCMTAEVIAELEAEDRYQRGLEQLLFLNGDLHTLARRIVRGCSPKWLNHKALAYINGTAEKGKIPVGERRTYQKYFADSGALRRLVLLSHRGRYGDCGAGGAVLDIMDLDPSQPHRRQPSPTRPNHLPSFEVVVDSHPALDSYPSVGLLLLWWW